MYATHQSIAIIEESLVEHRPAPLSVERVRKKSNATQSQLMSRRAYCGNVVTITRKKMNPSSEVCIHRLPPHSNANIERVTSSLVPMKFVVSPSSRCH